MKVYKDKLLWLSLIIPGVIFIIIFIVSFLGFVYLLKL